MIISAVAVAGATVCRLPPDKLARAIALSHWGTGLFFGGTAWLVLALWLLVRLRVGARVERLTARMTSRPWVQGMVVAPAWLLILNALGLPEAMLGHRVGLRFGLSVESWALWWADWAKATGLTLLVGTLVLGVLYALMRHTRLWWIWFWALTVPMVVVATFVAPIVVDPLFNHFTPLARTDPTLVDALERVAARGGLHIPRDRIFLMDASRKVTGPNAYVTGLGASRRIVVWDTTLKEETPDEILFTYGHEQGHYVLHHIAKGIAFSAVVLFVFYAMGYRLLGWLVRRRGKTWGIDRIAQWSSMGLVLLIATVLSFLAEPVGNAFSRRIEHQADVYGQEVIHGLVPHPREAAVDSFCSDAENWLDNPAPNGFVEFWTYSHPSTEQRAKFAEQYDPWLPGREPRYFRKAK